MVDNSERKFPDLDKPISNDMGFCRRREVFDEGFSQGRCAMSGQHIADRIEIELMKSGLIQTLLTSFLGILFQDFWRFSA